MADNLKKKKLDGKRISLTQKHERDYLKKIAKEMLAKLQLDAKLSYKFAGHIGLYTGKKGSHEVKDMRTDKLIRICKALLKFLKRR